MDNKIFYLLVVFACMAVLTSCNDHPDNPLVGTWKSIEDQWDDLVDFGYSGTWRFDEDGDYNLEFGSMGIYGVRKGYSSGTYDLISDSIMVVQSTDHENLNFNYAFPFEKDTLFVNVADSRLTSSGTHLVGPMQFERAGTVIEWEK